MWRCLDATLVQLGWQLVLGEYIQNVYIFMYPILEKISHLAYDNISKPQPV